MKSAKDVLKAIKDNDVKYVDFRFTDPRGKWQHVTFDVAIVDMRWRLNGDGGKPQLVVQLVFLHGAEVFVQHTDDYHRRREQHDARDEHYG